MANHYFQFKKFRIQQERTAMKVSTDACIQGAWFVQYLQQIPNVNISTILDIGTGTGLLTLMLAQHFPKAKIVALEIDEGALQDANLNFSNADFGDNIVLEKIAMQDYKAKVKFDLIICNPPFFNKNLKGKEPSRNHARHDDLLPQQDLISFLQQSLSPDGYACVLYPDKQWENFETALTKSNLFVKELLHVYPNEHKEANRKISILVHNCSVKEDHDLYIRINKDYSGVFKSLMSPYYLEL